MSDTKRRIIHLVSEITQTAPADVEQANQFTQLERWDSLMHLNLVLAIEENFGVQFGIEEITTITSVDTAIAQVAKKTHGLSISDSICPA